MNCSTFRPACITLMCIALSFCAASATFTRHPKTFLVGPNPNAIVAADLDGNGLPEIVTANTGAMGDPRHERPANDELSLLVATSSLEYATQPPLRTGFAPYAIVVGNVDALKAPDIVVASFFSVRHRDMSLFRNMGDNLFEPSHFRVPNDALTYNRMRDGDDQPLFTSPGLTALVLRDFNGDGYRDVIATGWSSDVLVVFPGTPDTYFGEPSVIPAAEGPRDIQAADFDGDGHADLALALYSSHQVALWRGDGAGVFEPATHFGSRGRLPSRVRVGDMNRDDRLDLIVSHCYTDDSVVLFYGGGGFEFGVSQEIILGEDRDVLEHEIRDMVVADLNNDARLDIATACHGSKQVVVLINDSSDTAVPQKFTRETYEYEKGKPHALCVADFNADGALDVGVALWDINAVSLLLGKPEKRD